MMAANNKRRKIARINLELCFPRLSLRERERLLRRHFIVSGQSYFDLAYLAFGPPSAASCARHISAGWSNTMICADATSFCWCRTASA